MKPLTYQEAAEQSGFSVRRLRRAASKSTPMPKRLRIQDYGHCTKRILPGDLQDWILRAGR